MQRHKNTQHIIRCAKCDFIIHSNGHRLRHLKARHEGENGMLWVSDSIYSNVDFHFISKVARTKIRSVKAYSATYDEKSNFPYENFLDVIDKELVDKSYKSLVIGGGSVDITNIDTASNPEENISAFREKAIDFILFYSILKQIICNNNMKNKINH